MNLTKQAQGLNFTSYLDTYLKDPDVHDVYKTPISSGEVVFSLLMAIIVGLIDLWLTLSSIDGSISAGVALAIHLVLIMVGFVLTFARSKAGMDVRASSTTLLFLLMAGPFGALGSIAMILSHLVFRQDSLSFSEWVSFIYPRPEMTLSEEIFDDIDLKVDEHPRQYDVLPFMDVMRLGSVEQKREAINQVTLNFEPAFAPVLQAALKDSSLSVRTLAATAIARLEKQLQTKEHKLEQILQHTEQTPELLLATARFYDDYAFSGLVDSERKEHYIKQAYDFYQRYIRRRSGDTRVAAWVGRLLVRSGQLEKAASWLKQLIDEGRSDGHILSWYLEVLHDLGRYTELRAFAQNYAGKLEQLLHDDRFAPLADTVKLWLGRAEA